MLNTENNNNIDGISKGIAKNTIFLALLRPPTVIGVPIDYMVICFLIIMSVFICTEWLSIWCVYAILHGLGVMAYQYEPQFCRISWVCMQCKPDINKKIWHGKAYDAC